MTLVPSQPHGGLVSISYRPQHLRHCVHTLPICARLTSLSASPPLLQPTFKRPTFFCCGQAEHRAMPTRGYAACRDSSRTLAWALVMLTATSALVHATEQDVQASVGVALEPAPPPGYFRVIIQVRRPPVKV